MKKGNTRGRGSKVLSKDQIETTSNLAEYLSYEGQFLLPMVDLVRQSKMAVDELMDQTGRALIEAILLMSAREVAGPKRQGKRDGIGEISWHGKQFGQVALAERKLRVNKPRLRTKGKKSKEVEIPAYAAMQRSERLSERMMEIMLNGVSTRKYEKVLPEMAATVGVAKSSVSREFIEQSAEELKKLSEREFKGEDILIIYIDGMNFGKHHIIAAIGVDKAGYKHVLGIIEGATENAIVVKGLLEDLQKRGITAYRKRLFIIDGSKALRSAIDQVYGEDNPVQRCRKHKMTNVCGYLPEGGLKESVLATMKAAYKLSYKEGIARLKKQAEWLEREYPAAANSLLEGLEESFTINRLGLSPSLMRGLGTTNIIESPNGGVRRRSGRVSRWRDGQMVLRWAAASFLDAEKNFRRIMGHRDLWILRAALSEREIDVPIEKAGKVA
jgi:transposase-like protein